ncbi:MBL fold metallo-hydrolase [Anaerorhabdus sp.]|uniref:MBL fold metallo-hydrolase n=1 Tax=Anaerorhabdus sp. TaxID=1872524 RepID=UPI002FCC27A4
MKITYIGHSGFLVELENHYLLFDYFEGDLPVLDSNKKLLIFSSHNHHDHYNPKIWKLNHSTDNTIYILSFDIPLIDTQMKNVYQMKPYENLCLDDGEIVIHTFKSTDEGVAFLVEISGKVIYHAGDLNMWKWEEESDKYNKAMEDNYLKELELIQKYRIDIAFLPLDPRQERYAYDGIKSFVEKVNSKMIFPMHFWKDYSVIEKFKTDTQISIMNIEYEGQEYTF